MTVQLALVAIIFLAIGIYALLWPKKVYAHFGVRVETPEGRNEIRAVYGGMCLAIGILLLEAPWLGDMANGILLTVMALLAGMAAGRIVSLFVERAGLVPMIFMGLEILGAGLLFTIIDFSSATGT